MDVEIVAMSQPVLPGDRNPIGICEQAASVCYDSVPTKSYRIAKSCMSSGHMSVMEHISFTFHVKGISRACLAQLSRHRHISLSVRSQRYCREDNFDFVNPCRSGTVGSLAVCNAVDDANRNYKKLLNAGLKPEDARMVLPNACCTELYLTVNARSLIEMSHLRLCSRAQREIRELFSLMRDLLRGFCPEVAERMAPSCEAHTELSFCHERESCGKHPKLSELLKLRELAELRELVEPRELKERADADDVTRCKDDAEHEVDAIACTAAPGGVKISSEDPREDRRPLSC